ncbi:MFS transporter [Paenibacillus taichungensis]|uniref:MFS transporter n=1 Tax=Paenibacillus taichungensis TaxID=484184 RepID=UPI002DBA11DC|nr:MFS transporter [Paenibacillus taichungensis]MEC0106298.1 MFS transporter [Paenibacillus taichungensis]MEC0200200.1 MFS transporter [Paenibacillus taichungensis]
MTNNENKDRDTKQISGSNQYSLEKVRMPIAVYFLAFSIFIICTAELLPMGLLPHIARDFDMDLSHTGLLITVYALGVAIGGPLITAATGHIDRKKLLIGLLILFVGGALLSAITTDFNLLMVGRLLCSFSHGTLVGVSIVVVQRLAPAGKEGRAISYLTVGLTVATVLGVPVGTFIGSSFGWRMSFYVLAIAATICVVGMAWLVPVVRVGKSVGMVKQTREIFRIKPLTALLTTIFSSGGLFAGYTYIAPYLEEISGFSPKAVSPIMLAFGLGSAIGNIVSGKLADKGLMQTLLGSLIAMIITMTSFSFFGHVPILAILFSFLWGLTGFAIVTPLNMLVLRKAGDAADLAASLNISAFNIGSAIGAALGGVAIHTALGLRAAPLSGAVTGLVGILFAFSLIWMDRQSSLKQPINQKSNNT